MTDQLLRIKAWDSDLEEEPSNDTTERGAKNGREDKVDKEGHLQKVQKLIYAAKVFLFLRNIVSVTLFISSPSLNTTVDRVASEDEYIFE